MSRRSLAANLLLVVILFIVPLIAVFVVPLVLRWAGFLPARKPDRSR